MLPPMTTLPRAILFSVLLVAVAYLAMNFTLLGSIPWREVEQTRYPMSLLVERAFGRGPAWLIT